jgi:hypothetical protein
MAAAEAASEVPAADSGRDSPVLAGRWQVDAATPIPEFDRAGARAYAAHDIAQPEQRLIALVGSGDLPMRSEAARILKGSEIPGLLQLMDYAPIPWPTTRERRMAFVYARPAGEPVAAAMARREMHGREVELAQLLLRPIVQALSALARLNIAHRAVRPDNLWFAAEDGGSTLLGDAISAPAGFDQPSAYEPIERAMAQPAGRGEGTQADDVFALGVTLLALTGCCDPGAGRSEAGLIAARLEKGSYYALIEGVRLSLAVAEPLRGMLADDPQARWSLRDVEAWLDGRRPALRGGRQRPVPETPFALGDDLCTGARQLARALFRHPGAGVRAIRSGALELWVRNDLHDPALAKRIAETKSAGRGFVDLRQISDEALLARVGLLLDAAGPIRYGAFSFAPDGFGPVLAREYATGGDMRAISQMLTLRLDRCTSAARSTDAAREVAPDHGFATLETFLRSSQPGYGIERCLYQANPGLACMSPALRGRCVCGLDDLLPALEEAAAAGAAGAGPVDRHVAAFISSRAGSAVEPWLDRLGRAEAGEQAWAQVGLLAWIASRYPGRPVPNLVAWIGRGLRPVVMLYRNRNTRATIEREIRRVIGAGDLPGLSAVVCDADRLRRDLEGFQLAAASFARTRADLRAIAASEPARRRAFRRTGVHAAVVIACTAAAASASVSLLLLVR